jgi:phasin
MAGSGLLRRAQHTEKTMSKKMKLDPTETVETMTTEATAFAQKSVDQAQAAFEKASEIAHGNVQVMDAAASAAKARFADLQMKTIEFTQDNVNSAFAFARKMFATPDMAGFISLQQDYLRSQGEAFQRQAKELNDLSVALAKETVKPVQDSFGKSFSGFGKAFAA